MYQATESENFLRDASVTGNRNHSYHRGLDCAKAGATLVRRCSGKKGAHCWKLIRDHKQDYLKLKAFNLLILLPHEMLISQHMDARRNC